MARIEVKVPDIGGYDDVPVIEVLVAVGDTVKVDQGLVTLESDKATMEVPSSAAGKIVELKARVGDKVGEGTVIAVLEAEGGAAGESKAPAAHASAPAAAPAPQGQQPAAPAPPAQAAPQAATPAPQAASGSGRK